MRQVNPCITPRKTVYSSYPLLMNSLNVPVISTDQIRRTLRATTTKIKDPLLYASSYESGDIVDPHHQMSASERAIHGFDEHARRVFPEIEKTLSQHFGSPNGITMNFHNLICSGGVIIEGVHLTMEFMEEILLKFGLVIPFLVTISDETEHLRRMQQRQDDKYRKNFDIIRSIDTHLVSRARSMQVGIPITHLINPDSHH